LPVTDSMDSDITPVSGAFISFDEVLQLINQERSAREAAITDVLIRVRGGELEFEHRIDLMEERLAQMESHFLDETKPHPLIALGRSLECCAREQRSNTHPYKLVNGVGGSIQFTENHVAEAQVRLAKLETLGSNLELDVKDLQKWRNLLDLNLSRLSLFVDVTDHEKDNGQHMCTNGQDVSLPERHDQHHVQDQNSTGLSTVSDQQCTADAQCNLFSSRNGCTD